MHKHPHRIVEKTADNRYWQDQHRVDDKDPAAAIEFADYEPPTVPPSTSDAAGETGQQDSD